MKIKIEIHAKDVPPKFYSESEYKAYQSPPPTLCKSFDSFQDLQKTLVKDLHGDMPCKRGFFKIFFDEHCVYKGNYFKDTYIYRDIKKDLEPIVDFLSRFEFLVHEDVTVKDYRDYEDEDDEDDAN